MPIPQLVKIVDAVGTPLGTLTNSLKMTLIDLLAGENYQNKSDGFIRAMGVVRYSGQPDLSGSTNYDASASDNLIVGFRTTAGGVIKYKDIDDADITRTLPANYLHPVQCKLIYANANGSTGITTATDIITYELVDVLA